MKIAVCDDLRESLEDVKKLLEQISFVKKIDLFSEIDFFYEELKDGKHYDAVLMDIDWKSEQSGIDFAAELQKFSPYTKIIYITAFTMDYVEDIFLKSANLSGFLMKPIKSEQLLKNLEKIRRAQEETEGQLIIKNRGNVLAIPFRDIIYLESQLHKVNIILNDYEYQCSEQLSSMKKRLGKQFLDCHKSYIVNMEQIAEFRSGELLLKDGRRVPVSKKRQVDAKTIFFEYISERM